MMLLHKDRKNKTPLCFWQSGLHCYFRCFFLGVFSCYIFHILQGRPDTNRTFTCGDSGLGSKKNGRETRMIEARTTQRNLGVEELHKDNSFSVGRKTCPSAPCKVHHCITLNHCRTCLYNTITVYHNSMHLRWSSLRRERLVRDR